MARLPELCEAFFAVDGRDHATIRNFARVVREGGYIATTKRGVGASEMTSRDAANLMIALEGCEAARDAVDTVERLRALKARPMAAALNALAGTEPYRSIARSETFGEALERTIDSVPGLLMDFAAAIAEDGGEDGGQFFTAMAAGLVLFDQISITFSRTTAIIERIAVRPGSGDQSKQTLFRMLFILDAAGFKKQMAAPNRSDRNVSVRVGMPTLVSVWKALHGEAAYAEACAAAKAVVSSANKREAI
jgi:hypothetical protein